MLFVIQILQQQVLGWSVNTELGTVWKEVVVPRLEGCFDIYMEEVNKTTEFPTGGSLSLD